MRPIPVRPLVKHQFTLISEANRPVAAILDFEPTQGQREIIYALLPYDTYQQTELAERWHAVEVLSPNGWRAAQLRRIPMSRPKGPALSLIGDPAPIHFTMPTTALQHLRD